MVLGLGEESWVWFGIGDAAEPGEGWREEWSIGVLCEE